MATIRSMIEYLLENEKDISGFMTWAFGKDYELISYEKYMLRWNTRHGKKFKILPYGRPEEDLHSMISKWREKK
jgi:hypothetical protein